MKEEKKVILEGPQGGGYICADIHEGQLPRFLEEAVTVSDMAQQQDMLLLSALTACSWALPHIKLLHDRGSKVYYPNLMTMVVAPPASGKGLMANARKLIEPIDRLLQVFERRAILADDLNDVNFFESLMECEGNGFMLVTEMDLISKSWKKDSGYSSLFRQAFEHESWSRDRHRGNKKVHFEVKEPKLSVVLTGTENQVKPLLGTGENGLACRFWPYILTDVNLFDVNVLLHGDKYSENGAKVVYERLGEELLKRDFQKGMPPFLVVGFGGLGTSRPTSAAIPVGRVSGARRGGLGTSRPTSVILPVRRSFNGGGNAPHLFGKFRAALLFAHHAERAMTQNAGEIVMEMSLLLRRVVVDWKHPDQFDQRFLNHIVSLKRREAFAHERLHHRTIARHKFAPAGML